MTIEEISGVTRSPLGDGSALDALFASVSAARFLGEYWPERVIATHGLPARLPAVFQCPELSSFRALASRYAGQLQFGRGASGSRMLKMSNANPAHLYEMGLSVYMPDISANVPGAAAFLQQLEAELGIDAGSCRISVWASPQEDGVPTHFDGEDVISIQLVGTKRFEVAPMKEHANPFGTQFGPGVPPFGDLYPQLENGFPEPVEAEFQTVDMKPGSVLFIPRGTWHRTTAYQDSFSISININPPCVIDAYLEQMRNLLLQDPEWRRPLYGARGSPRQREEILARARRALQIIPHAVEAISLEDIIPLPETERLKHIERKTRFQRDLGTRMEFDRGADVDHLQVKLWDRDNGERTTLKMQMPSAFTPVFEWLATSKVAFPAGELADRFAAVPFPRHQEILNVLTRAGFLKLLWFPRLPKR